MPLSELGRRVHQRGSVGEGRDSATSLTCQSAYAWTLCVPEAAVWLALQETHDARTDGDSASVSKTWTSDALQETALWNASVIYYRCCLVGCHDNAMLFGL